MTFETIRLALEEQLMDGNIRNYYHTSVNGQDVFYVDDHDGNQRVIKCKDYE